jgi:thiamine biosynthesis lipoprotein
MHHDSVSTMRAGLLPALVVALLALACVPDQADGDAGDGAQSVFRARQPLMGTFFDIQVVAADSTRAEAAIQAAFLEVARVEELISEWRESSEISQVNANAGREPVVVGPDLFSVVERSLWVSELTGGAFDITFGACGRVWSFREARIPGQEELESCLERVDYRRLRLDRDSSSIGLPTEGMCIGIGGIGKGYGVDRAVAVLESHGFSDYIVDGGGDVRLRGANLGRSWSVGIAHPRRRGELYGRLSMDRGAVVTSGDYERFFERDGEIYHHILDPATGRPASRSVAVTVIAPTALDADALATGLFVLGPEKGIELAEGLAGVEALFFSPDLSVRRSSGFPAVEVGSGPGRGLSRVP